QLFGNRLSLEVTRRVGDFVLLLVGPAGELERLIGTEDADGSLRLARADGSENLTLADFFGGRNLDLVVSRRGSVQAPGGSSSGSGDPGDDEPDPTPPDDDDD